MLEFLRTTFTRGIVTLIPVILTAWVLWTVFNALDQVISPLLVRFGLDLQGMGVVTMLVLIFLVGLVSRNLLGNLALKGFDGLMKRIPIVRVLYSAIKDVITAFSFGGGQGKSFQEVVLVEYPRKGLYAIGFVTNRLEIARKGKPAEQVVSVYFPHPPNPTSGVMVIVPRKDIRVLDLPVQEGLKIALSGAIVSPGMIAERGMRSEKPKTKHRT
ncbi:MAG: DUF502 domain-containing protein [Bacteroidota bacterium]